MLNDVWDFFPNSIQSAPLCIVYWTENIELFGFGCNFILFFFLCFFVANVHRKKRIIFLVFGTQITILFRCEISTLIRNTRAYTNIHVYQPTHTLTHKKASWPKSKIEKSYQLCKFLQMNRLGWMFYLFIILSFSINLFTKEWNWKCTTDNWFVLYTLFFVLIFLFFLLF